MKTIVKMQTIDIDTLIARKCRHYVKKLDRWVTLYGHLHNGEKTAYIKYLYDLDPTCKLCGEAIESIEDANTDHILERANGGVATIDNLQLTHIRCNWNKSNKKKH